MNGLIIKQILQKKGITLSEVANKMATSVQNLSGILNKDDIRTGLVESISEATGIPLSELYGISPSFSATNTGINSGNIAGRDITTGSEIAELQATILSQQKTIAELSATISRLVK